MRFANFNRNKPLPAVTMIHQDLQDKRLIVYKKYRDKTLKSLSRFKGSSCLEIKLNKNVSKSSIHDRLSLSHLPSLSLATSHALLGPLISHELKYV